MVVHQFLTASGVNDNCTTSDNRTPLSSTIAVTREDIVQLLLYNPCLDLQARKRRGLTPLCFAVNLGYDGILKLLLATPGIDISALTNIRGSLPVALAISEGHANIVRLLVTVPGADVSIAESKYGCTL
jgi:ankyrin repeat protein